MKVLVLHGPNLNLLGEREPEVYGRWRLEEIDALVAREGERLGLTVVCRQENAEGALVETLHAARHQFAGVVFNPAAYTHYSIALRDAVAAIAIPVVEVHLSNTAAREEFRRTSLIAPVAVGTISGFGPWSYVLGLQALAQRLGQAGPGA